MVKLTWRRVLEGDPGPTPIKAKESPDLEIPRSSRKTSGQWLNKDLMIMTRTKQANISSDDLVVVAQDLVSADLEKEAVILNLKDGVYYGLDPVGARIWNLLQEPKSVNEILDILLKEYEVEPQTLNKDLMELLQEMASKGLIEIRIGKGS